MFAISRRLTRPIVAIALLAFGSPALAADCVEMSLASSGMACCLQHDGGSAGLKPDCCSVQTPGPAPERPAGTAPSKGPGLSVAATADLASTALPLSSADWAATHPAFRPPLDRLYLRFSVIRR